MKKQSLMVVTAAALSLIAADRAAAQASNQHAGHTPPAAAVKPSANAQLLELGSGQQQAPDTTVTIRSQGSDLEFLPSEIAFKQGTRVRIRYINEGTFPHNIVIVKSEDDIDALGLAAFQAGSTGYVPMQLTSKMVAHSPLAAPGSTVEFTFVMPAAGTYPFVCLYPGHYNMMIGSLKSLR